MAGSDRRGLGQVFDDVPELYDRVRPGYPDELFADLATIAGIDGNASVLEVGCGTGQATRSLAALGCAVTAVEPGAGMAALARRRTATFGNVDVELSTFEEWDDRGRRFDVVVAASAWHWVDPTVGWQRAHDLLHPGGRIALLGNVVVRQPGMPEVYAETADLVSMLGAVTQVEHADLLAGLDEVGVAPLAFVALIVGERGPQHVHPPRDEAGAGLLTDMLEPLGLAGSGGIALSAQEATEVLAVGLDVVALSGFEAEEVPCEVLVDELAQLVLVHHAASTSGSISCAARTTTSCSGTRRNARTAASVTRSPRVHSAHERRRRSTSRPLNTAPRR